MLGFAIHKTLVSCIPLSYPLIFRRIILFYHVALCNARLKNAALIIICHCFLTHSLTLPRVSSHTRASSSISRRALDRETAKKGCSYVRTVYASLNVTFLYSTYLPLSPDTHQYFFPPLCNFFSSAAVL